MNRLRILRKTLNISTRDLQKYTGIQNSTISYLENGVRPFRQVHVDKLSAFFNVTSDYLLGRTDYGFIVHSQFGDDTMIFAESEYKKNSANITEEIIKVSDISSELKFTGKLQETTVCLPKYVVYRELKSDSTDFDLKSTLNNRVLELCKHMDSSDLKKTITFIEDYILK